MKKNYEFECNLSEEYKEYKYYDEWGAAMLWVDDTQGVEYNFCINGDSNSCAIYKVRKVYEELKEKFPDCKLEVTAWQRSGSRVDMDKCDF